MYKDDFVRGFHAAHDLQAMRESVIEVNPDNGFQDRGIEGVVDYSAEKSVNQDLYD